MSGTQGGKRLLDTFIGAHHFYPIFDNQGQLIGITEIGVAAVQRTKLALPAHLPCTAIVITYPTRARSKHCRFHCIEMAFRNKKNEFIHKEEGRAASS